MKISHFCEEEINGLIELDDDDFDKYTSKFQHIAHDRLSMHSKLVNSYQRILIATVTNKIGQVAFNSSSLYG